MGRKRKLPCDYVQCVNTSCPLFDRCLRAVEEGGCVMRSRTKFEPDEDGNCEFFIDAKD